MNQRRQEILRAVSEASQLLARFPTGKRTSFDIVGATAKLDVPVVFRPLDGLWGAALTVDNTIRGILVTTKLDLAVQRFTLAHELGHVLLGHKPSFDEAESIGFAGRLGPQSRSTDEVAADTFASELLAPRSLMLQAARRHGWDTGALRRGENVYQLSLRLGLSFIATCWALAAQKALTRDEANDLQAQTVKELKNAVAPDSLSTNPWAARWTLTASDSGTHLEAGPDDIFAVHLSDYASAGYLWELVEHDSTVDVLDESSSFQNSYDTPTARVKFLQLSAPGLHSLSFVHKRRWANETIETIDISVDNHGKECAGLPRSVRSALLAGPT